MRTKDITQYLRALCPLATFYTGAIDSTVDECIGVYANGQRQPAKVALGGLANTSYTTIPLTILIHWSENADSCEQQALELYNQLLAVSNITIADKRVISIDLLDSYPQDVGRDSRNICEMVIRLNIICER